MVGLVELVPLLVLLVLVVFGGGSCAILHGIVKSAGCFFLAPCRQIKRAGLRCIGHAHAPSVQSPLTAQPPHKFSNYQIHSFLLPTLHSWQDCFNYIEFLSLFVTTALHCMPIDLLFEMLLLDTISRQTKPFSAWRTQYRIHAKIYNFSPHCV